MYNTSMDKETESKVTNSTHKLNWLRASVLGANDGIVSIAGLVLGVAGATDSAPVILTAGIAGIVAGAISMAAGEYVSVSSSRDTEMALLQKERYELKNFPEKELQELASIYRQKGLTQKTSEIVAEELSKKNVFAAHAHVEFNLDPNNLTNPWHAAFASSGAFLAGAMIPLLAIIIPPASIKVPITFMSVVIALAITGFLSAKAGEANAVKAMIRVISGGALAMTVTYFVGKLFSVSGI
jgi:VIT1/CCC1 family predicted Fe2+/Mn2+ transporter